MNTGLSTLSALLQGSKSGSFRVDISLADFVERTSRVVLDAWQHHLCSQLERAADETGLRLAIHAPPQHGKSLIVSQRFPAWMILRQPDIRTKLACHNITHAARFGRIVKEVLTAPETRQLCANPAIEVNLKIGAEEWSTAGRKSLRDAQPSFKALGLQTGFVGQTADLLIIDDPYASPDEAYSEVVNNTVWRFWTDTAKPRLTENSNVVLMFHRYTENDLAGKVLSEGNWELLRYSAEADGGYEHPETGQTWIDPLNRQEGELLTPRFSRAFYDEQKKNGYVWLSQFQGRPTAREGVFFKIHKLEIVDVLPHDLPQGVRKWDFASSPKKKADQSVGVKIAGPDHHGLWYILDCVAGRWTPDDMVDQLMLTAQMDGRYYPIHVDQDPAQAGVYQLRDLIKKLSGYPVHWGRPTGEKSVRAAPFATQVNVGNVRLLRGDWNREFIEELRQFPFGSHDDRVDAASGGFNFLNGEVALAPADDELIAAFSYR